jgi:hypothetical protein
MKILIFVGFIFSFLLISCNKEDNSVNENTISENIDKPDSIINLAGNTYGLYKDGWYTIINDYKGDLVDTVHIILRLVDDGDVKNYNFENIGLPKLEVKSVTDSYYEVEIPIALNPFNAGKKLWDSNDFKELFFNVFLRVQ